MALLNTPNLYLNLYGEDNMYDSELLTRQYKTWSARSTLGSVCVERDYAVCISLYRPSLTDCDDRYARQQTLETEAGIFEGHAGGMWVRTLLDSISVLFLLYFVIEWQKLRSVLAEKADAAACSMADYTVSVRPRAAWPDGFDRSLDNDEKEEQFIEDLKKKSECHSTSSLKCFLSTTFH